ncbi:MAG TPA: hypothetical protein PKW79_05295, partial [Rhabdochlamydiaceae bacterium]|nr:hypothetical protein [Rhabdochlamydiaceae bacterium]
VTKVEQWIFTRLLGVYSESVWTGQDYSYREGHERHYEHIEGYTVNRIMKAIQQQMGLPLFGNNDVYAWALEWNPSLEDRVLQAEFETFGAQVHDNFLKAMLVDMGIFRIKQSRQTTPAPARATPQHQLKS